MARAKAADPETGYATDFVSAIVAPHLEAIAESGGQQHVAPTLHEQRVPEHLASLGQGVTQRGLAHVQGFASPGDVLVVLEGLDDRRQIQVDFMERNHRISRCLLFN